MADVVAPLSLFCTHARVMWWKTEGRYNWKSPDPRPPYKVKTCDSLHVVGKVNHACNGSRVQVAFPAATHARQSSNGVTVFPFFRCASVLGPTRGVWGHTLVLLHISVPSEL